MIFVLGIERSATTWVSNILDMHPGTELYMEPLSGNTSRFNGWPDRFERVGDLSERAQYFREEFEQLKERKRFLFSRVSDSNVAWNTDIEIARKLWGVSLTARDFFELNFHRVGSQVYPPKSQHPIPVIKELRLNFNARLIRKIDPDAKVIVILRNFASNVLSIEDQVKSGNLEELTGLLREKYSTVDITTIFTYWAESYNSLLADLEKTDTDFLLVRQEDLIKNGIESVDKLFGFLELQPASTVYDYLYASNKSGSGKHSTDRDHDAILNKNREAEEKLRPVLKEQIQSISWHPLLKESVIKT